MCLRLLIAFFEYFWYVRNTAGGFDLETDVFVPYLNKEVDIEKSILFIGGWLNLDTKQALKLAVNSTDFSIVAIECAVDD